LERSKPLPPPDPVGLTPDATTDVGEGEADGVGEGEGDGAGVGLGGGGAVSVKFAHGAGGTLAHR
jgi:hypothetical protein